MAADSRDHLRGRNPEEPATPESDPADTGPSLTRRALLAGAAGAIGASVVGRLPLPAEASPGMRPAAPASAESGSASSAPAPAAPMPPAGPGPRARPGDEAAGSANVVRVQGRPPSELGTRAPLERPRRSPRSTSSRTPLQDLHGTITPADLHYERHHGGVAEVDPAAYTLLVHGAVERSMIFTLDELKRLPSVSRIHFLECSGNFWQDAPEEARAQDIAGMTSQSEWTGVLLSTLLREVGASPRAKWLLAEGQDAALLSRSIPIEKAWDDALIAYGQNGEALRPENGYPVRLLCPGWEGNTNVKWLRRIELAERPFMSREETSKYTEPLKDGTARQFSFVMDARSIVTTPSHPQTVRPGWLEVRGIAWSGRGRIARAELSFDEGATWHVADLKEPVLPKAHVRFRYMWKWDGRETTILSRAVDETGYVQPTLREWIDARGPGSGPYHRNPITGWRIRTDGGVVFRTEAWA